jgi:hypothetical protein
LTLIAGEHAKAIHDELVTDVCVKEAQADEKWSFVGKKEEFCLDEEKQEHGDQWDHNGIIMGSCSYRCRKQSYDIDGDR